MNGYPGVGGAPWEFGATKTGTATPKGRERGWAGGTLPAVNRDVSTAPNLLTWAPASVMMRLESVNHAGGKSRIVIRGAVR